VTEQARVPTTTTAAATTTTTTRSRMQLVRCWRPAASLMVREAALRRTVSSSLKRCGHSSSASALSLRESPRPASREARGVRRGRGGGGAGGRAHESPLRHRRSHREPTCWCVRSRAWRKGSGWAVRTEGRPRARRLGWAASHRTPHRERRKSSPRAGPCKGVCCGCLL
jgi:hypothetical protein